MGELTAPVRRTRTGKMTRKQRDRLGFERYMERRNGTHQSNLESIRYSLRKHGIDRVDAETWYFSHVPLVQCRSGDQLFLIVANPNVPAPETFDELVRGCIRTVVSLDALPGDELPAVLDRYCPR